MAGRKQKVEAGVTFENLATSVGSSIDPASFGVINRNVVREQSLLQALGDDLFNSAITTPIHDAQNGEAIILEGELDAKKSRIIKDVTFQAMLQYRLFGASVIVLGDENPIDTELSGEVLYATAYSPEDILHIGELENDYNSENFGRPKSYTLRNSQVVPASRAIALRNGYAISDNFLDVVGVGERVYHSVVNYRNAEGSTLSSLARGGFINLSVPTPPNCSKAERVKYFNEVGKTWANTAHNRVMVTDKDTSLQVINPTIQANEGLIKYWLHMICVSCGLPSSKLLKTVPSGLNTSTDNQIRDYYSVVRNLQKEVMLPIYRAFGVGVEFAEQFSVDMERKANVAKIWADIAVLADTQALGDDIVEYAIKELKEVNK